MAIAALEHHPIEEWGSGLIEDLRRAASDEPDDQLRERMLVLAGKVV